MVYLHMKTSCDFWNSKPLFILVKCAINQYYSTETSITRCSHWYP